VIKFDKVCQRLDAASLWFSQGTPVSFTNKTDSHKITEILLKVALSTIQQTNQRQNNDVMLKVSTNQIKIRSPHLFTLFFVVMWEIKQRVS
jgi:hypothetical protein